MKNQLLTMVKIKLTLLTFCLCFGSLQSVNVNAKDIQGPPDPTGPRQNHSPIILLHGFTGWGRDEALDFNYWGGIVDVQEHLKEHNFQVFTTASGPISSSSGARTDSRPAITPAEVTVPEVPSPPTRAEP